MVYLIEHHHGKGRVNSFASLLGCHERRQDAPVGILLLISALILVVSVLLQSSESSGIGAVSGAAETFFGKNKAKGMEAKLALTTKICAGVFVALSIVLMFLG